MTPSTLQQLEHAVLYGDHRLTAAMLDTDPTLVDARFPGNLDLTPLMWACRNRRESIVAELLRRGADPTLINRVEPDGDGGNTALWFTGQGPTNGTTGIASRLLTAGADVNAPGEHGLTSLHIAASWCHLDLVQLLLDQGADPSMADRWGRTPIALVRDDLARFGRESSMSPDRRRFVERSPRVITFLESAAVRQVP